MNQINNQTNRMKEMPPEQQPYEKCFLHGPGCLSDAELLAVVIRTGSRGKNSVTLAADVLHQLQEQSLGGLFRVSLEQLQDIPGIGPVKAIQLKCMVELSRRLMHSEMRPAELVCDNPEAVAAYYMNDMRFLETEQVRLLILNAKNHLIRDVIISSGSFNASLAAPREVYYNALKYGAVSIILLHNHPSGDPSPSREDLHLTRRLVDTGVVTGVALLDHIIIGDNRYISLKQSGYLTDPRQTS